MVCQLSLCTLRLWSCLSRWRGLGGRGPGAKLFEVHTQGPRTVLKTDRRLNGAHGTRVKAEVKLINTNYCRALVC